MLRPSETGAWPFLKCVSRRIVYCETFQKRSLIIKLFLYISGFILCVVVFMSLAYTVETRSSGKFVTVTFPLKFVHVHKVGSSEHNQACFGGAFLRQSYPTAFRKTWISFLVSRVFFDHRWEKKDGKTLRLLPHCKLFTCTHYWFYQCPTIPAIVCQHCVKQLPTKNAAYVTNFYLYTLLVLPMSQ